MANAEYVANDQPGGDESQFDSAGVPSPRQQTGGFVELASMVPMQASACMQRHSLPGQPNVSGWRD